MLDFTFTDEQEMLRDTVRKFMQKEVSLDFVHQIDEKRSSQTNCGRKWYH